MQSVSLEELNFHVEALDTLHINALLCYVWCRDAFGLRLGTGMNISKDLVAASAAPLVLAILAEGDSYGYAIIKRVSQLSGGHLQWTDGMLYPMLHRLERLGYIEAHWSTAASGRRRRYYRITDAGQAHLKAQRRQWQVVDSTLRGIWMGVSSAPEVRCAPAQWGLTPT